VAAPLALSAAWHGPRASAAPASPGQRVSWPDITLLDGSRWSAAQWAGRPAVVVFWSTTCPFCRRHNQHVEKLFRAANGTALTVLGVARERDAAVVQRHARQEGYSFPITLDQGAMGAALSTRRMIPLTITVDRLGHLLQAIPGEMFEEDVMELLKLAQSPLGAVKGGRS
jgi:thiol-disulfide isomerase/thioredoxin